MWVFYSIPCLDFKSDSWPARAQAIKEETGDRGWVPSWFVGKYTPGAAIPSASIVPPTPTGTNTASSPPAHETSDFLDVDRAFTSGALMNGSPLSQAFPAKHSVPPI